MPALHPREGSRHSPVNAVLLTNADIDHVAGLLSLREAQPFTLLATPAVHQVLRSSSAFDVLAEGVVTRRPVELGASFELVEGVTATIFPVPGKIALYLEAREEAEKGALATGHRRRADHRRRVARPAMSASSTFPAARR